LPDASFYPQDASSRRAPPAPVSEIARAFPRLLAGYQSFTEVGWEVKGRNKEKKNRRQDWREARRSVFYLVLYCICFFIF